MSKRYRSYLVKKTPTNDDKCCCGDAGCTDFEDRMKMWGIPLEELTVVQEAYVIDSSVKSDLQHPDVGV